ncbi:FecR domain-containing protein [Pseudomonas sp. LP_7_YM]|uniref:FecR family protein n=1 Tax=Pseudomonas sp. LP_7_YM TaxID=2485137 RepID=UPI00105E3CDA|nr:FecR domain-containing protein [Pseudomonas sp. LP_7_YM]TDV72294.1 FecR family protein [Pseudomonas sp. LP_7_YM]
MSSEPPFPDSCASQADEVTHQASAWFALMQAGAPTQAQREELAAWMAADPRHAQAYAELETLWAASAQLLRPRAPVVRPQLSRRRFVGLGIAASAVAVTAGATRFWLSGMSSPFADVRTAVGERRLVHLPDGSSVDMAGNTALNLDFSPTRRSVELLQGEAFFNVVPSAAGELKVSTQAGQVMSADAGFCLSCTGDSARVAVNRKAVRVTTASQQTDLEEGLSLDLTANRAGAIQHADLEQILAWRNGRLVFFDTPLLTVVDELQRWREGRMFIMDKQLAARRVSLILSLDRPEQMLDVLSKALSVRTQRYTDLVTLIYPA